MSSGDGDHEAAVMYYKSLTRDGLGVCSDFRWSLPKDGNPGQWHEAVDKVVECVSGYHACTKSQLIYWLSMRVFVVESQSPWKRFGDKSATKGPVRLVRELAWTDRSARLFVADCAEYDLAAYEDACPGDDRPRKAIEAGRAFARGEITREELDIARAEAWDAAKDTTYQPRAVADAAWAAGRDPGRHAVCRIAARATSDATRRWQVRRLFEYLEGVRGT